MRAFEQSLIRRLRERNVDRERATDGGIHPRAAVRPAGARALRDSERAIGFKLPELLRAVYQEVGNGGFGAEYGIVGTKGGAKLDGYTLESCYRRMLKLKKENAGWRWPARLLPVGKLRVRHLGLCGLRVSKASDDHLGPEQSRRRARWRGCPAELGELVLGCGGVVATMVGGLAGGGGAGGAEMAE